MGVKCNDFLFKQCPPSQHDNGATVKTIHDLIPVDVYTPSFDQNNACADSCQYEEHAQMESINKVAEHNSDGEQQADKLYDKCLTSTLKQNSMDAYDL